MTARPRLPRRDTPSRNEPADDIVIEPFNPPPRRTGDTVIDLTGAEPVIVFGGLDDTGPAPFPSSNGSSGPAAFLPPDDGRGTNEPAADQPVVVRRSQRETPSLGEVLDAGEFPVNITFEPLPMPGGAATTTTAAPPVPDEAFRPAPQTPRPPELEEANLRAAYGPYADLATAALEAPPGADDRQFEVAVGLSGPDFEFSDPPWQLAPGETGASVPAVRTAVAPRPSRRRRLPLVLRLILPALLAAASATCFVLLARHANAATDDRAATSARIDSVVRDNVAVEGTLLRARSDLTRTVADPSPKAVQQAQADMRVRSTEAERFRERVRTSPLPADLAKQLDKAYVADGKYLDDVTRLVDASAGNGVDLTSDLDANARALDNAVEGHREAAGALDRASEQASAAPGLSHWLRHPLFVAGVALLLLALAALWWAVRTVNRPLGHITNVVDAIAAGDLGARTSIRGRDRIGKLASSVDTMANHLDEAVSRLEDDARRGSQNRVIFEALDIADNEAEVHRVAEQALALFAAEVPAELLLSEQAGGRLWRVASSPTAGAPGCSVASPASCFALRRGQAVTFDSAESINSCPKLRNRPSGPCSAVCIPVTFAGQALGVLHATGPDHEPPEQPLVDQLIDLSAQLGARIGTLRTLESTRLQAATDGLTGLPNRRMVEARVKDLVGERVPFVFILADLDRFKSINDRFGHEVGDRSLQLFADTLIANVRDADVVARYGGEEFVIIYPELTVARAMEAIERLRIALAAAQVSGSVPTFTCSFGVTHSSVGGSFDEIFRVADAGLLVAKEMGRNRPIYADVDLADRVFGEGGSRETTGAADPKAAASGEEPAATTGPAWSDDVLDGLPTIPSDGPTASPPPPPPVPKGPERLEGPPMRRRDLGA